MRSDAKASTAGSAQRQAKGLGRFFRGADATRDALLDSKGSSALAAPFSSALLVALFFLAALAANASAAAPAIPTTTVSAVTSKAALLEADINPEGEATTYHFEYGPADCASNPCTSMPVPDGNVGSGSAAVRIKKEIGSLSPDTTYHFHVVATNATGTTEGPDTTFTTYPPFAPDTGCANDAFRTGASANLPDCRAYEMVSPVDKGGGDIATTCTASCIRTAFNQASLDGEKITYSSSIAFGDAVSSPWSSQYIASRGATGWSTHGISPPHRTGLFPTFETIADFNNPFRDFSDDLSRAWVLSSSLTTLTPDALQGSVNLYERDNEDDSYRALTINELAVPPVIPSELVIGVQMQGRSADGEHALFLAEAPLTPNAAAGSTSQLYDFSDGQLHLVSVLPDGTANPAYSWAGTLGLNFGGSRGHQALDNTISEDGSRVFWSSGPNVFGGPGDIYLRENPAEPQSALNGSGECTEPQKACTTAIGFGQFWTAATDGSKMLYSSSGSLRLYNTEAETSTVVAGGLTSDAYGNGAVFGASDDLSRIYFVSTEALAAGATAGRRNLYLDSEGTKTFIAALSPLDTGAGGDALNEYNIGSPMSRFNSGRVTPDGSHLVFQSSRALAGNDNIAANNGEEAVEVYRYDADADELICVSCSPSGARPVVAELQKPFRIGDTMWPWRDDANTLRIWAASWLTTAENSLHTPRTLSDDGNRVFFNSFNAIVPQDTNGAQDVYQWEAQGTGNCQKAGGCVSLISTGQSPKRSEFVDANADGSSVFIETSSSIDPRDPDLIDIYVARENGGYPPPPPPPPPCVGDACQSVPAAPNDPTPASAGFRGSGNPVAQRNCGEDAKRAAKLRRQAGKASRQGRAARAAKLTRQAKQLSDNAARCRRANRGAGR